jgi:cell division septum initiation protein DivIVA
MSSDTIAGALLDKVARQERRIEELEKQLAETRKAEAQAAAARAAASQPRHKRDFPTDQARGEYIRAHPDDYQALPDPPPKRP